MKRILIIQSLVKQYRLPFFESLHNSLKENNFKLKVAYGEPYGIETMKADNVELNDNIACKVKNRWFLNGRLLYQPLLKEIHRADLVIIEQANKHLINYYILILSLLGLKKVAFWGHGLNHQGRVNSFSEQIKKLFLNSTEGWFAYTNSTTRYLTKNGVPSKKITTIQNSIDTLILKKNISEVGEKKLNDLKKSIGISNSDKVGLYCGSLYKEKNIPFLIDATKKIKSSIQGFQLIVIGAGPERYSIEEFAASHNWVHYLGPKFKEEKALYFKMADIFLNPGLVGLSILDAFAAGLPIITTDIPIHSPEIEYLENGVNGFITSYDTSSYSKAVVDILKNDSTYQEVKRGAISSSNNYSIENMVANFKEGILRYLAT